MFKLAVSSILGNKLRLSLTGFAVVLGVSFISGTLIFSDTIEGAFEELLSGMYEGQDVIVQAEKFYDVGLVDTPPFPDHVLDDLLAVPTVEAAEQTIGGFAIVYRPDGEAVNSFSALGNNWIVDDRLAGNRELREGRPPAEGLEVAIDAYTVETNGLVLGDDVEIQTVSGVATYRLVAVVGFGGLDNVGGASLVSMPTETATHAYGMEGRVGSIAAIGSDGVSVEELVADIEQVLPAGVEALPATEVAAAQTEGIQEGLGFIRTGLLAFAAVAVIVAALIILNTFKIIVHQRERELALVRAIGATRNQVLQMILTEAVVVGLAATVIGIAAGFVIAWSLTTLIAAAGLDMPPVTFSLTPGAVVVCLTVGVGAVTLAAWLPARRAARVPPVAALRTSEVPTTPGPTRTWVGILALAWGGGIIVAGLRGTVVDIAALTDLGVVGVGALLVFVGVSLLGSHVVGGVSAALRNPSVLGIIGALAGAVLVAGGIAIAVTTPGLAPVGIVMVLAGIPVLRLAWSAVRDRFIPRLAAENTRRNSAHAATSSSALMIGVALVALFLVLGESIKASATESIGASLEATYVVTPARSFTAGVSPVLADTLNEHPDVVAATSFRTGFWDRDGNQEILSGVDPDTAPLTVDIALVKGTWTDLGTGVFVFEGAADRFGWDLGDEIVIGFAATGPYEAEITGIYAERDIVRTDFLIAIDVFEANFDGFNTDADTTVLVLTDPALTAAESRAVVEAVAADYANVRVEDHDEYLASRNADIDTTIAAFTALIVLAVLIAIIGIANTMALSMYERTREIGLLRAVGMTRTQVQRLVTWESLIIAIVGSTLGAAVGVVFGVAITVAMAAQGVAVLSVPVVPLSVVVACGAIAGLLAAIVPARSAARRPILESIAYE
jgi:putative ABC transport system permease protein